MLGGAGSRTGEESSVFWEVEDGRVTLNDNGSSIVGSSRHFCCGEGAEPNPVLLSRLTNLGHPSAPGSLSNTTIDRVFGGLLIMVGHCLRW